MIVHLQSRHSAVYSDIVDQLKTTGSAHSSAPLPKDQLSIEDSFKKLTPLLNMFKVFEPRYTPPDRTTFSRHYLPELYTKEREKICKQTSDGLQWYAVTCDGWSSRANHSYLSVTLHYINNEW